jgi:cation diffusion facilitator CzcD-associated flavoprotein CzcO
MQRATNQSFVAGNGAGAHRARASLRIAIVGAGFAGIGLAIQLKKHGYRNIVLFEKADRIGGTWRENSYPGAACDVPSHLYSFSFAPKTDWEERYGKQSEILAYIEDIARRSGVDRLVRLNTPVRRATFDEGSGTWSVEDARGSCSEFDIFVTAVGQLSIPSTPRILGAADFAGSCFHSASWDHSIPLAGRRIAVVGSAASAVQIVPEVAKVAAHLSVFQRTPNWMIPRFNRRYNGLSKALYRWLPPYRLLTRARIYWSQEMLFGALKTGSLLNWMMKRLALRHLNLQVLDLALRSKLTPHFEFGCKRVLISDDYYPCFSLPNVELVTQPIERFVASGLRTTDGRERNYDVVVFATGFDVRNCLRPIEIHGRNAASLQDRWTIAPEAYRGILVPDFPNLFLLYGPNTNLGHNSILFMLECQFQYILQCLNRIVSRELLTLEVMPAVNTEYNRVVQQELARMTWTTGCGSWYGADGRISANWSGSTWRYWRETRRVRFEHLLELRGPRQTSAPTRRVSEGSPR